MLNSFLLFMDPQVKEVYKPTDQTYIGGRLQDLGYRVIKTTDLKAVGSFIQQVDGLIICSTITDIEKWGNKCLSHRSLPFIWWLHDCPNLDPIRQLDVDIDGMICSSMTDTEIHCSLHLCANHYLKRMSWQKEKEWLLSKLEERKHIEKAKAILCEIKNISESEAYDFIRKQAMDERKRIVDVATSIISVYPLLVGNKGD